MNRKKLILCIALLLVVLTVCTILLLGSYRRITVISGERFVSKCPKFAKPGDTVTVYTSVISDGELYVNGVDGRFLRPGEFQFVMPDEDVQLKVTVVAFKDGA
jgi:hypothetical protein